MYYWVNQGKTFKEEKEGGYLWAPVRNSKGNSFFHWENMKKLSPNDIVFNYRKGGLVGYCVVESEYYYAPQPDEFHVDVKWENDGLMVDARYYMLKNSISLESIYNEIKHLLPLKYSPINNTGPRVKANQGYLYEISQDIADRIIHLANLNYLKRQGGVFQVQEEKEEYKIPDSTSRKGLVTSRVGQGEYRRRILSRWKYRCAVSKSPIKEILIASHIVPWREATDEERMDVHNGLLLSPIYDALFDRHLISFDDDGRIILSKAISEEEFFNLGITGKERIDDLSDRNKYYLKRHRENLVNI
jgi:putative restriction endonuclease